MAEERSCRRMIFCYRASELGWPLSCWLTLTHQNGRHFADDIFRCIFVNESFVFWLKFHWSLFLWAQLTISQHWYRYMRFKGETSWIMQSIFIFSKTPLHWDGADSWNPFLTEDMEPLFLNSHYHRCFRSKLYVYLWYIYKEIYILLRLIFSRSKRHVCMKYESFPDSI